jgi:polyferredoxin
MSNTYNKNVREYAEFQRDRRKWQIRRRFAVSSFLQLTIMTLFYLIAPFYMTIQQANTFSDFNSIIITLIGFYTGIVMIYVGAVTYTENVKDGVLTKEVTTATPERL